MQRRIDIGQLRPARRMPDGRVIVDARISRVGVQEYQNADGSIRRELRTPDEVFSPAAMQSFAMVPTTNDHPPVNVDASNARHYMVGASASEVTRDDDFVRTQLMFADQDSVEAMERGRLQVSCGYTCDYDATPGVHPLYGPYDGKQKNIRGNHIALVDSARAGEQARVRLDGYSVQIQATAKWSDKPDGTPLASPANVVHTHDVADPNANALLDMTAKVIAAEKARDTAQTERETEKARADAAEGTAAALKAQLAEANANRHDQGSIDKLELKIHQLEALAKAEKARADAAESPEKIRALVRERVKIESAAGIVLGDQRLDGFSDRDLQLAVLEKLGGKDAARDRSDDYVRAMFDAAIENFRGSKEAMMRLREVVMPVDPQPRADARSARQKMEERQRNAWNTPQAAAGSK